MTITLLAFATVALMTVPPLAGASSTTATTGEASDLTASSATLNGYIYPGDQQTSYYYQYGLTTAYDQQTTPTGLSSTTQTTHVLVSVAGLSVYTTYHYRVVAVNAAGTTDGQDRTFTTKKIPLTFDVEATPSQDLFATPFTVGGTLSGTGSADHAVVLQANPFPYLGGFKSIGSPALTDASGVFSFSVPGLAKNTQLRVATVEAPSVSSSVLVEFVAVRVTLHLRPTGRRGYARFYGTVTPAEFGAPVEFQLLRPGRTPTTVASAPILHGTRMMSRFSRVVRIRRAGLYRAFVEVVNGEQASNSSRAILIR